MFDPNQRSRRGDDAATESAAGAPGRRPLTTALPWRPDAPVQRVAAPSLPPPATDAVAQQRDLDAALRPDLFSRMEAMGGVELGDVRVHRDSPEPRALGAHAFAQGTDIHLGPGQEHHLGHEAWHVVQQKQGRVAASAQFAGVAGNADEALEREADEMAALAATDAPITAAVPRAPTAGGAVVQLKLDDLLKRFDSKLHESLRQVHDELKRKFGEYPRFSAEKEWLIDLLAGLGVDGSEHKALRIELLVQIAIHIAEMKQDAWEKLQALLICDEDGARAIRLRGLVEQKVEIKEETKSEDEDDDWLFKTEHSGSDEPLADGAINGDHWLNEFEDLSRELNRKLKPNDDEKLVSSIRNLAKHSRGEQFASAIDFGVRNGDTANACKFFTELGDDRPDEIGHLMKVLKLEKLLKTPDSKPVVEGKLHPEHWISKEGFKSLRTKIEEHLEKNEKLVVEGMLCLSRIKQVTNGGTLLQVLEYLAQGTRTPSNTELSGCFNAYTSLDTSARLSLLQLIELLEFTKSIDQIDGGFYFAFHPQLEKVAKPGRPPDEVFEEAEKDGWLHRGEKEILIELLGLESAAAFVDHEVGKKRMGHLRMTLEAAVKTCDRLRRNKGGRNDTRRDPPLGKSSLLIDTNIAIILLTDVLTLEERFLPVRKRIVQLIEKHGITDLRLTNMTVIELYSAELTLDDPEKKPEGRLPFYGVPLSVPRSDQKYKQRMRQLEQEGVGESKGAADRSMMLDCFFAEVDFEGPLKFVTIDRNIIKPLMRQGGLETKAIGGTGSLVEFLKNEELGDSFKTKPSSSEQMLEVFPVEFEDRNEERSKKEKEAIEDEAIEEKIKVPEKQEKPKSLFETPVGTTGATVRDYMSFIEKECGFEVLICGGAVRDIVHDENATPNDIDLTTTMPCETLFKLLKEHKKLGRVHMEMIEKLGLIQISRNHNQLDITAGKKGTEKDEKKLDLAKDLPTRDFCMNALYLGLDEKEPRDPSGKGKRDAEQKRATHVVDLEQLEKYLRTRPFEMARLIKFAIRGYQFEETALEIVRKIFGEIIESMSIEDREQFYGKMTAPTPREAIEALTKLGIPNPAIRTLFPDTLLGRYGDRIEVYRRDLGKKLDDFGDDEKSWDRLSKQPDRREDVSNKRTYQERRGLLVRHGSGALEPIIVDIDSTDHDLPGHPNPHFHIYRWINKKWDKNGAGLSHTGQPGVPLHEDGVYLGPAPWTWIKDDPLEVTSPEGLLKCLELPKDLKVEIDGEMVRLGTSLTIHFRRLQGLGRDLLATLLLAVLNMEKHGLPSTHDESFLTLTRTHGLCFHRDDDWVGKFLARCGMERVVLRELPFPLQLRLHRLARRHLRTDEKRLSRAGEALANLQPKNVDILLERLELFLEVGDDSIDLMLKTEYGDAMPLEGTSLDDRRQEIKKGAEKLGFTTPMAGATAWARFTSAGGTADDFEALLLLARDAVANSLGAEGHPEQDGSELHRFTGARAIVTVRATKAGGSIESIEPVLPKELRSNQVIESPKQSTKPIELPTLEKELIGLLKQAKLREKLGGKEVGGSGSQFGVKGGSSACAPIATIAIGRIFGNEGGLQRNDIDTLLHDGALVYAFMRMYQQESIDMVRLWVEAFGEEDMRDILQTVSNPYFNPTEVPEVMLTHNGIEHAGTVTILDGDDHIASALKRVQQILLSEERIGVAIVVGAYTFSITRVGDTIHLFDSHGDLLTDKAFDAGYALDDWGLLAERVTLTMTARLPGKTKPKKSLENDVRSPRDISLSTFIPRKQLN